MNDRFKFRALINGELLYFDLEDLISKRQPFSVREVLRERVIDTIEQYIGMRDINNLLIYEQDIVEDDGEFGRIYYESGAYIVEWNNGETMLVSDYYSSDGKCSFKKVSNIHENPDLLKE